MKKAVEETLIPLGLSFETFLLPELSHLDKRDLNSYSVSVSSLCHIPCINVDHKMH